MEAYDVAENNRGAVLERLEKYVRKVDYETREAFDEFVVDNRRIQGAVDACSQFLKDINRLKVDYSLDRRELRDALKKVRDYADKLIAKLEGSDAPKTKE